MLRTTCVIERRKISTIAKDVLTRHYRYNFELNLLMMLTSLPFRFFHTLHFNLLRPKPPKRLDVSTAALDS